jgi:hypothetical protein
VSLTRLKWIDVEDHQRQRRKMRARVLDQFGNVALKEAAVVEPGQRIE